MRRKLREVDWEKERRDSAGTEAEGISDGTVHNCIEDSIPLRKKMTRKQLQWMSKAGLEPVKEKRRFWDRYLNRRNKESKDGWMDDTKARNIANSTIR